MNLASPTDTLVDRTGNDNASNNDQIEVKCEPDCSYGPTDSPNGHAGAGKKDQIEAKCEPRSSYSPTDYPTGQAGGTINTTDSNKATNVPGGNYRPTDSPIDDPAGVREPSGSYSPTDTTSNSDEDSNTIMRAPIPKETVGEAGASQQYDETRTFLDLIQKDNTSTGADILPMVPGPAGPGPCQVLSRLLHRQRTLLSGTAAQKTPRKSAAKESYFCGRRPPCR